MANKYNTGFVWFRRNLRLEDNASFSKATKECRNVVCCFVFDPHILNVLEPTDQRVSFIMESLYALEGALQKIGGQLVVRYGNPENEIASIVADYNVDAVYAEHDIEPYPLKRDQSVKNALPSHVSIQFLQDIELVASDQLKTGSGSHYRVFTPYKRAWLQHVSQNPITKYRVSGVSCVPLNNGELPVMDAKWFSIIGFKKVTPFLSGGRDAALQYLHTFLNHMPSYDTNRDFPAVSGTSMLSVYLRFGCISIREAYTAAVQDRTSGADVWLSELIWRDFYRSIVTHYPQCAHVAIKPEYDAIEWEGKDSWFTAWCNGNTGFPIVDAAMRQLNTTGFMHNRCRMIVASFLCKTLLLDWRQGEAYFAKKLLDFDFCSNNGGWQWASSSGCDAQPYFRIFNPYRQSERFDPDGEYIKSFFQVIFTIKQI